MKAAEPTRSPLHRRPEEVALVVLVGCLLGLAFAQILMRNLFQITWFWADPLLRHLVLWSSFLGALVATRQDRHIRIDAVLRLVPPPWRPRVAALGDLVAAALCGVLAPIALRFVLDERAYGAEAFPGVPAWVAQLVFPAVFAGMALRFLVNGWRRVRSGA